MIKKVVQGAIGVAILAGLYVYGRTLPDSPGSRSASGYVTADRAEHTVLVQRVARGSSGETVDVRVTAKVPLIVVAIESQLGSLDGKGRFIGSGPEIYIPHAGLGQKLAAGQTVTHRGVVPRNPGSGSGSGSSGEFLRTKVRFNYVGDTNAWDGNNPRYRTVVDLR